MRVSGEDGSAFHLYIVIHKKSDRSTDSQECQALVRRSELGFTSSWARSLENIPALLSPFLSLMPVSQLLSPPSVMLSLQVVALQLEAPIIIPTSVLAKVFLDHRMGFDSGIHNRRICSCSWHFS